MNAKMVDKAPNTLATAANPFQCANRANNPLLTLYIVFDIFAINSFSSITYHIANSDFTLIIPILTVLSIGLIISAKFQI